MSLRLCICLPFVLVVSLVFAAAPGAEAIVGDGPYASLSDAAKQRVRDRYEDLAPDDEPPYPLEGMGALGRLFSEMIPTLQLEGTLFAAVEINEKGEATGISFHSLPISHAGATEAEIRQTYALPLVKARYKPALCKGVPCTMAFPVLQEISRSKRPEKAGPRSERRR